MSIRLRCHVSLVATRSRVAVASTGAGAGDRLGAFGSASTGAAAGSDRVGAGTVEAPADPVAGVWPCTLDAPNSRSATVKAIRMQAFVQRVRIHQLCDAARREDHAPRRRPGRGRY